MNEEKQTRGNLTCSEKQTEAACPYCNLAEDECARSGYAELRVGVPQTGTTRCKRVLVDIRYGCISITWNDWDPRHSAEPSARTLHIFLRDEGEVGVGAFTEEHGADNTIEHWDQFVPHLRDLPAAESEVPGE